MGERNKPFNIERVLVDTFTCTLFLFIYRLLFPDVPWWKATSAAFLSNWLLNFARDP